MTISVLDYIFFVIIFIFAICALVKGFINEFFGKAALILGIIGSVFFYDDVAKLFMGKIDKVVVCNIIGFVSVFVVVFLVVKLIGLLFSKIFQISILYSLDKVLGFSFGFIEGAAIVCFIIFLLQIQPFFNSTKLLNGSFCFSVYTKIISSPEFKEVTTNV